MLRLSTSILVAILVPAGALPAGKDSDSSAIEDLGTCAGSIVVVGILSTTQRRAAATTGSKSRCVPAMDGWRTFDAWDDEEDDPFTALKTCLLCSCQSAMPGV
jgi:hypothetical protein